MGMGFEIPIRTFNQNNILSDPFEIESSKNISEENNDDDIKPKINKSIHFQELQKRFKSQRKNTAPEYLFDEKNRKIFYSIFFNEKKEKENFYEHSVDEQKEEKKDDKKEEEKEDIHLQNSNHLLKNNCINNEDIFENSDNIIKFYKKKSFDFSEKKNKLNEDELMDDFELNYYKKGVELRNRYMSQLINKGVWMPNNGRKKYNSIIIFDWDDTLLPTTFLNSKRIFNSLEKLTKFERHKILELEELILQLLTLCVDKGDVYIITNAESGWVEYSSKLIYPRITNILQKINIISARNSYEDKYPGDLRIWKIQAFMNLTNNLDIKKITNIICLGDSTFEIEAGKILASKFTNAFIKTIKFKEKPELNEVFKQILLVCMQFNTIHSSVKNLTIRVEKKKKGEKII